MSQKSQSDGGQKHFAVGRGLLAAAETLNFSMSEQRSSRQMGMGGMSSGVGLGGGGMEGQDGGQQMSRRGGGGSLGNTMKLFASLGLSPSDLDALAEIPEEDISVETLPQILMQLKSRKGDAGERRAASSMSSDAGYRGGRDSWDNVHMGRMGGSSLGSASARAQGSSDFGFSSLQDAGPSRGYSLNYGGGGGGGGSRDRPYSELSRRDSYSGLGMGPPAAPSSVFLQRMGSPSNGKVQDFLGAPPAMFPHVCSLCDFDVHSTMEWNQHTNGLRHAENRRLLLNMYPEWDPGMSSGRGGGGGLRDAPNMSAGLLGPAPVSSHQTGGGGMSSSWGGGGGGGLSGNNQQGPNTLRSRVVVVKYDRKPLSNKTLFAFTKPFGVLREHLVLKNKAFLEMNSHEEAVDMVNYYEQHQAALYGKPITIYLSKRLLFIEKDGRADGPMDRQMDGPMDRQMDRPMGRQMDGPMGRQMDGPMDRQMDRSVREVKGRGSQVVFFSNLPREEEKKKELLTISGRFGVVEKHLFLTDQAFVQLGTPEDAEMLVKYYSVNPLTIRGRPIRLNICTKYKTLNVNRRQGGDGRSQRGSGATNTSTRRSSPSPRRSSPRRSSPRRSSPSPRRSSPRRSSSSPRRSSSSSRTREDRKKEVKEEVKEEEEEEEVSGAMEGDDDDGGEKEEATDGDAELEQTERDESEKETLEEPEEAKQQQQEQEEEEKEKEQVPVGDDVTADTPGDVGGADGEAESERRAEVSTEEPENQDEAAAEPVGSSETLDRDESADDTFDEDLENMEDFVTLDELAEDEGDGDSDAIDNTRTGGMRVVNIVGFRRGYNFLNELLALAEPFGKVVKHLVLDLRAEAYFQFTTEEEARAMAKFYNSNIKASVCGRPVRISHSMSYPTIQCGSSRVVYVGQIPDSKYSDDAILKLAEPFGRVKKYFLNRIKRECFIEMEKAEEAEKMAENYKENPTKFNGKRLNVYVSRKYRQLKHGHRCLGVTKRANSPPPQPPTHPEEPPAKKQRGGEEEEKEEQEEEQQEEMMQSGEEEEKNSADLVPEVPEETQKSCEDTQQTDVMQTQQTDVMQTQQTDVMQTQQTDVMQTQQTDVMQTQQVEQTEVEPVEQQQEDQTETSSNQNGEGDAPPPPIKPSVASLPLPPHDPDSPIGVEHVKLGYFCRVCFLFYSNEDLAKKTHCSSRGHYDKLQKYLEKEQSKAEKKKGKKTPSN